MARLTFQGVEKRYRDVTALASLDLEVADGEAVCILGPSGSGKSTALRLERSILPRPKATPGRASLQPTARP
jgi:ABC-type sugar transport system ATPase subunit